MLVREQIPQAVEDGVASGVVVRELTDAFTTTFRPSLLVHSVQSLASVDNRLSVTQRNTIMRWQRGRFRKLWAHVSRRKSAVRDRPVVTGKYSNSR